MRIKNLGQIYTLLVCLIAVVVLMVSSFGILNSSLNIFLPEIKHAETFAKYASNEAYLKSSFEGRDYGRQGDNQNDWASDLKNLSKDDLSAQRLQEKDETLVKMKTRGLGDLLESALMFFIATLFFIIHWSLYRRTERHDKVSHVDRDRPIRPRIRN